VVVTQRPVLTPAATPTDEHTLHLARAHIVHTVHEMRNFADTLHTWAHTNGPAADGSPRTMASSAAQMCQVFARNWPHGSRLTPTQVAQFNRELDLVQTMLDALATRPATESPSLLPTPPQGSPPQRARRPADDLRPGRAAHTRTSRAIQLTSGLGRPAVAVTTTDLPAGSRNDPCGCSPALKVRTNE
jgi:hypothetical protein